MLQFCHNQTHWKVGFLFRISGILCVLWLFTCCCLSLFVCDCCRNICNLHSLSIPWGARKAFLLCWAWLLWLSLGWDRQSSRDRDFCTPCVFVACFHPQTPAEGTHGYLWKTSAGFVMLLLVSSSPVPQSPFSQVLQLQWDFKHFSPFQQVKALAVLCQALTPSCAYGVHFKTLPNFPSLQIWCTCFPLILHQR